MTDMSGAESDMSGARNDLAAHRAEVVAATMARTGLARQLSILLTAKARNLRPPHKGRVGRALLAVVFGMVMCVGAYKSSAWGAILVMAIDPTDATLGVLVMRRMIEMGVLFVLSALGMSNLISALTTFFLARDLEMLHPMPVRPVAFYTARLIEVCVQSAWVLVPVVIPSLWGVGRALRVDMGYYVAVPFVVVGLVVPISAIAIALATIIARVVPATRAREVFLVMAGLLFVGFYVALRSARPEQFIDPQRFKALPELLGSLGVSNPWLPSTWAADFLMSLTQVVTASGLQPGFYLLAFFVTTVGGGATIHVALYEQSHSRAREVRPRPTRRAEWAVGLVSVLGYAFGRRGADHAILVKEAKTMLRDPQQWTQILMLGALLVLFVYNFRFLNDLNLPDGIDLSFNLAITGFVIGALGARFVYPLVSLEGSAIWVLRSAPVSTERILKAKAWAAFVVLEMLGVAMGVAASVALELPLWSGLLSIALVTPLAHMASRLGIGLGAMYPRFNYENPAMIPMSFGGMMYVYWALGTVLVYCALLGWPLFVLHSPAPLHSPVVAGLTVTLTVVAFFIPFLSGWVGFRLGVQRLDDDLA